MCRLVFRILYYHFKGGKLSIASINLVSSLFTFYTISHISESSNTSVVQYMRVLNKGLLLRHASSEDHVHSHKQCSHVC